MGAKKVADKRKRHEFAKLFDTQCCYCRGSYTHDVATFSLSWKSLRQHHTFNLQLSLCSQEADLCVSNSVDLYVCLLITTIKIAYALLSFQNVSSLRGHYQV